MKIALLSFEFPPETGFGGIGTYTWYQARALARLGHEVHVLAGSRKQTSLTSQEVEGVFVHRYRAADPWMRAAGLLARLGYHWTRNRLENAWCMYRGLRQLMTKHDFDVVEMPECGAEGALLNWLIHTPTVVRFHSPARLIMPFYPVPWGDRILCSFIEALGIRGAGSLTSCSRFLADAAQTELGVRAPVHVIPNGIDLAEFDREPVMDVCRHYNLPPGKLTILFAGRMEQRKGIHLCGAIAELVLSRQDVTLLFAGQDVFGYLQSTLLPQLEAKQLLGSVRYLGKLGLEELRALARSVDIYLLPSLWENCPYACLEAMSAGRAVVCSHQGGMPELIEHNSNGLLAEPGSPVSFAEQLTRVIESPALRHALGTAARSSIEQHFTDAHIALASEAHYRRSVVTDQPTGMQPKQSLPVK